MQNLVTCVYEVQLVGLRRLITIAWLKDGSGHGVSVTLDDSSFQFTCMIRLKPWSFWKKHGMKTLDFCSTKVDVLWDLSSARFEHGPEPHKGFYVAVACNGEMVLLLGDRDKEAYKKVKARTGNREAVLLSRTEHIFGNTHFRTTARFGDSGKVHDIDIECPQVGDPCLSIRVDKEMALQVKNLDWKFRGNQTVLLNGSPLEVFWDVHNWVSGVGYGDGGVRSATFIFQAPGLSEKVGKGMEVEKMINWSGKLNDSISMMKLTGSRSVKSACEIVALARNSVMLHAWRR